MRLKLSGAQVMPPHGSGILVGTRPNAIYGEDGKSTGQIDGIRCDVRVLPDLDLVTVKVPGATAPISNAELEATSLVGQLTWVGFDDFVGSQWLDRKTGALRVSATASAVHIVPPPTLDDIIE